MNIKNIIREYIQYDNLIIKEESKLKKIKKKREELSSEITNYFDKENKLNINIKAGDSKLSCKESITYSNLNQCFIKKHINSYFKENYKNMSENDVNKLSESIFNHILNSRIEKKKIVLKRI